ncbi:uncharacterized protein LOC112129109 [Pongo abelii]|uniref:uncharacterized protein LOC112129109 n=1 Tax=Pongo abelii TaxID=9601 RepID=UPI0023E8F07C|nr:uncharacterized protein LOC112129109 [Pongo abelii]
MAFVNRNGAAPRTCGAPAPPSPAASSPPVPHAPRLFPWDPPLRQPPPRWLPLSASRDSETPLPRRGLGAAALRFPDLLQQLWAPRPLPPLLPCSPLGWPPGLQRAAPAPALGIPQRLPGSSSRPCLLAASAVPSSPGWLSPQVPALATQALSALRVAAAAGGPGTAGWELPRSVPQAPGRREPARLARTGPPAARGRSLLRSPPEGKAPDRQQIGRRLALGEAEAGGSLEPRSSRPALAT